MGNIYSGPPFKYQLQPNTTKDESVSESEDKISAKNTYVKSIKENRSTKDWKIIKILKGAQFFKNLTRRRQHPC